MNSRWLTVVFALAAGLSVNARAAEAEAGDPIEFSVPSEGGLPVRPMTERDFTERQYNFQRREAPQPDTTPVMAVPAPDYTTAARALQTLIDRTSSASSLIRGGDLDGRGGDYRRLMDSDSDIDAIIRRRRSEDRLPDWGRVLDGQDNRYDLDQRGEDPWTSRNREPGLRDPGSRDPSSRDPSRREWERGMSPAADLRGLGGVDLPSRDDLLFGREPATPGFNRLNPREAEVARERAERMDSYRELIGIPRPEVRVPGAGAPAVARPDPAPFGDVERATVPDELVGVRTPRAVRQRDFSLDVGTARRPSRLSDRPSEAAPAATPLQIMERKHSSRIPIRDF